MFLVQRPVDLRSRSPHCRSFPPVQHPKLQASLVNYPPSQPVKRVDLSENCPLSDPAETRVTGAYSQVLEAGCDEGGAGSCSGCGCAGLGACVAATNDDDIEWSVGVFMLTFV